MPSKTFQILWLGFGFGVLAFRALLGNLSGFREVYAIARACRSLAAIWCATAPVFETSEKAGVLSCLEFEQ